MGCKIRKSSETINENEEEIASIGNIKLAGSEDVINWNTLRKAINAKLSSDDFRINEDKSPDRRNDQ